MKQLLTRTWMVLLATILAVPLAAQTVTVNVTQAGGLWDALEAQGVSDTEFGTIRNLTVTGVLGDADFLLIKNQMSKLESIDISGINVTEIPAKTFAGKENLKTVRLPENICYIKDEAFNSCGRLEAVTFGNRTEEAGRVVFPAALRYVGYNSFSRCTSLTHLDFTACSVLEQLGSSAFSNMCNLEEVLLPSQGNIRLEWGCFSVDQIWDEAAQEWVYKGLESLLLPKAVTSLSGYALPRTLKALYVESATPPDGDEYTFVPFLESDAGPLKVYVPKGSKRNYAIANGWANVYSCMQELGFQVNIAGEGSVVWDDRAYADGDICMKTPGAALTLKAVPQAGYEVESVKLDGTALSVAADGTFTIPATTDIGVLDVVFRIKQLNVDITLTGNGSYTVQGQTYTAGTTLQVEGGTVLNFVLQPASGSFVRQVVMGGDDVPLKNGGTVFSTAALNESMTIAVTFSDDASGVATISFQQEGFGTVGFGGLTFEDGSTLTLVKGKSVTLSLANYGDSNLQSLSVGGADVTSGISGNTYTLSNVTANTIVKTVFYSPNQITDRKSVV